VVIDDRYRRLLVFVERSERRIPVQYAKRIVGRRLHGRPIHICRSS